MPIAPMLTVIIILFKLRFTFIEFNNNLEFCCNFSNNSVSSLDVAFENDEFIIMFDFKSPTIFLKLKKSYFQNIFCCISLIFGTLLRLIYKKNI
jgi:hypothetical protein